MPYIVYNLYMLISKSISIIKNKKTILFVSFLFFFSVNIFSQQLRCGIYGVSQFPVGEASEYFINTSGEGVSAELSFFKNFGGSVRIQYSFVFPKDERIESSRQFAQLFGLWYRFPLGEKGFAFQPIFEFGFINQETKFDKDYGSLSKDNYMDVMVQFSPSFRFRNKRFLDNRVEIEFSPLWSIIPEQTIGLPFIGARLSIIYIFN